MTSTGNAVPLTSVGAKMASSKSLAGGNPYTTRIVDNVGQVDNRMTDERVSDHIGSKTSSGSASGGLWA